MELTKEQMEAAATMSLADLRKMAIEEATGAVAPAPKAAPAPVIDTGKDVLGEDLPDEPAVPVVEAKPVRTVYRREIASDNGSGTDIYEADSLEELADKLAEGKKHANAKIRELAAKVKQEAAQISEDEEYIVGERLKTTPKSAVREIAAEVVREETARSQRKAQAEVSFVNSHPLYEATPQNAAQIMQWVSTHGYSEVTDVNLAEAYESLVSSGLLKTKPELAGVDAEQQTVEPHRTGASTEDTPQQRSPKKASGLSSRSGKSSANTSSQPTEDEARSMPLDKLRALANAQLKARAGEA